MFTTEVLSLIGFAAIGESISYLYGSLTVNLLFLSEHGENLTTKSCT